MSTVDKLWGERFAEPVFALTADQDWAPEWAMKRFLDFVAEAEVPLHLFVTNPSPAVERASRDSRVTLGAHPNFRPGSSHGSTPEEVVATCRSLVPEARTFRSHTYAEDASILSLMIEAGFETDSNLCLFLQPGIVPLIHATGILRLPVFLDDDSLLLWDHDGQLDLEPMEAALATPGLKILNFHPILFALNSPSAEHYEACREAAYRTDGPPLASFEARGTATVLGELIEWVRAGGHRLSSFPEVAAAAWRDLRAIDGHQLYRWTER